MDKLYKNPWFVKAISFLIALLLFAVVNFDNPNNQPGGIPVVTNGSYTIPEVPLNVYYNEDELAITEIVENVQVNLRGPQNVLTYFQIARPSYDVFVDLRNLEPGTHHVNVQYRNFPSELTVNIVPETIRVTIEEKRTISLPVEIDLINKAEVPEGYTVGTPIVNPVNVEITAAESVIQHVAFVKGFVDIKDVNKTVEKGIPVKVYDQQGNELAIDVSPSVVDVKIPVTSPNKDVPLKITRIGELPEGLSIRSIVTDPKEVTIFGPQDVIDGISHLEGVEVNLLTITENTVMELELPVPPGVEKVSPSTVKIIVEVDIEETLEIEEIPLEVIGLSERMDAEFSNPNHKIISLIVKGSPAAIEKIQKDDVKVYIDLNELAVGEHSVPIQVSGPQNISFDLPFDEIEIIISEVLSIEEEIETNATEEINENNDELTET
ncbi:hypothetical protein BKP45_02275 [Anaerobacillus alkalidiazotrophicus]|uniref:YbbR-like domain-containing protein YbbR n=1 Tax=Anaerobacillus alkalidiazotrophicus TaxID=472963 RepID=A0A1S2MAI9_9BACI|nr:CdaR family protein [Anaerobacillus alkalidiazotrophicus]OIJ21584.1 hypothetical protein BKP45_02275 [Anaerobacillus alkalidiazotrophicus]